MARYGFIHDKLDIKFLILYITARLAGPVDIHTLTDLTMCDEGVDYFDFSEAVAELVETGHLSVEDGLYAITDKGRQNGAACESSLPHSVRRKCSVNVADINGVLRRNAQVRTRITPREEGGCTVSMSLDDDGGSLLSLDLFSPSQEQGERLAASFRERPERVYNDLLSSLLEKDADS